MDAEKMGKSLILRPTTCFEIVVFDIRARISISSAKELHIFLGLQNIIIAVKTDILKTNGIGNR